MFQFRGFPSYTYWFSIRSMILHHRCSHIRISAARSLYAAPRSFSQLVTSFVGSQCQGILHMLFFAWTTFCISGDILSVLVFLAWIAVFHTCSLKTFFHFFVWQNCLILPLRKNLISFADISYLRSFYLVFSLYFVCHVFHTNSFELICLLLFGFQWTFLTLVF